MDRRIRFFVFTCITVLAIAIILIILINAIGIGQPFPGLGDSHVKFSYPPQGNHTVTVSPLASSEPRSREDVVYREDVIVYFKEMPSSLQDFASAHGVKLIFSKPDIKMAAFETTPTSQPGKKSAITQNFVASVSGDPLVESAEFDGFMFIDPSVNYTSQPIIKTPEDMEKSNSDYTPNEVTVGFWKIPPSVEEFGAKYGGTLINSSFSVNYGLKFATFNTNNVTSFIKNVSTDPYVRYANVNPTVQMDGYICPDNPGKIQVIDLSIN